MRLFVFFVTVLATARGRFVSIGNDSVIQIPDDRVDCADGACPENVGEHRQFVRRAMEKPQLMRVRNDFVEVKPICSCDTRFRLNDFGEGHYPRYITIVKCKAMTCANRLYQCKNVLYRSNVLVKRSVNSTLKISRTLDVKEVRLPDSLQNNWELLAFLTPVACIAVERT